jgi:transcriptional regulator with XRE-family HTH domain
VVLEVVVMTPNRLRELRELANLSQLELAKRSGVDRSRLSMFENGHVDLNAEQKSILVNTLRMAMHERSLQQTKALEKFSLLP